MICKRCKEDKSLDCYESYIRISKTVGHRLTCRPCRRVELYERDPSAKKKNCERVKEWVSQNKEKKLEANKRHINKVRKLRPWVTAMKNMLLRKEHRIKIKDSRYTYDEFKRHIESQFDENMSWDNWGSYWDVDHKRPSSSFTYEERYECHDLSNLQPLESYENRYIKKDWYKYDD